MELLTLPRLRNNQLQTVSDDTIKISVGLPQLESHIPKVKKQIKRFKTGMTKEKLSASDKKKLDSSRDELAACFIRAVKIESHFPHKDENTIATLKRVLDVVDNYGLKMTRLSYDEETAAMDNFIFDLKKIDFAPLANSGLARWIPIIEQSNKQFKDEVYDNIDEDVASSKLASASKVAPDLRDALNEYYSVMFAYLKIQSSPELETAYAQIDILLNSYR